MYFIYRNFVKEIINLKIKTLEEKILSRTINFPPKIAAVRL